MEKCVIIVDNSNIWIEGKKFSARQKGIMPKDNESIDDPSWRIDFGKLLSVVAGDKEILHAIMVGSRPPQNDSVWEAAKKQGFQVIIHDRNHIGKEKAVDTEIVMQGTRIICKEKSPAILKLLSGDRDFLPLIKCASDEGWETEMWAFTNAFNESGDMALSVSRMQPLDEVFENIGSYEFEWPTKRTNSALGTVTIPKKG